MYDRFLSRTAIALLTTAALFLLAGPAWAQRSGANGRGSSGHAGSDHAGNGNAGSGFASSVQPIGGGFTGNIRPAGFGNGVAFRSNGSVAPLTSAYLPYYGLNRSSGIIFYTPNSGGYNSFYHGIVGSFLPYYRGIGAPGLSSATIPGSGYPPSFPGIQPPAQSEKPAPDGSAHLLLTVPENAEVLIDGKKTTQTGTTREFVTPQLTPGERYVYTFTVRYTNSRGNVMDDSRDIRFVADDWFSIDFTRPAPPAPLPQPRTVRDE